MSIERPAIVSATQPERILHLNQKAMASGRYVMYWMQQSQRAASNHALEYAIAQANDARKPLVVVFGLTDDYPDANLRHYHFMLEGLRETKADLETRGIQLTVFPGDPAEIAIEMAGSATLVVCDRGYLRHQKAWREQVAQESPCRVTEVESDVVVPVETASEKAEYAARTIRPRIHRHLDRFLVELQPTRVARSSMGLKFRAALHLSDVDSLCASLRLDRSVAPVPEFFPGGARAARARLDHFIRHHFSEYTPDRNRPEVERISGMSPYLHFGQISPLEIALAIYREAKQGEENVAAYIEELVVRRELAHNFVHYTTHYDEYDGVPGWARATLRAHAGDARDPVYSKGELEAANTRDPYWNAAMTEMKVTGFMHNYMRMYWGKKILEWTPAPDLAYRTVLELNNRYFLDGRDPNSYANVGWVFGLHDRPWQDRSIFGTVRYMNARGLERKCDIEGYVNRIRRLEER